MYSLELFAMSDGEREKWRGEMEAGEVYMQL